MAHATRYRILFFCLALLVLIAVPSRPVGVADGLPADHPFDLWVVLLLVGGFFIIPWRLEPRRAPRLALLLLAVALAKLALSAASLPHGLVARYHANANFQGPPEASIEYRLDGATRIDRTIDFAPVGFAWGVKPFPLWFFNDVRRFDFYKPGQPDRRALPFSVRWDGFIRASTTEPVTWRLVTEQEATLSLSAHPVASTTDGLPETTIALSPGWHSISLTYVYRGRGPRSLRLEWDLNGRFRPVPSSALLPTRPSPLTDRWDQRMALPGWAVFALQFLVVAWLLAAGLRGVSKEQLLTERAAVYLLVVVMLAFGTVSLSSRGRAADWNLLGGGSDPLTYEGMARQILLDRDILNRMANTQPFYAPIGYRYVLAAAHALMGPSRAMVVLFQYGLLAAACAMLYWLVRRLAPPGVALFAMALFFVGPARGVTTYKWSTMLYPAVTGLLLGAAVLVQLAACRERPSWRRTAGAGLLFGLACVVRPNFLAFGPVAFLWLVLTGARPARRAIAVACIWARAAALTIAPVTWRNWHVSGQFTLLTNSVPNLLDYHNRPAEEIDLSRVGNDPLYQRLGLHPQTQKVLEYVRQRPLTFFSGLGVKALKIVGLPPSFSLSLLALHLSYLVGAALHWRRGRKRPLALLLHGFVLSQFALLILLTSQPRKNLLPIYLVAIPFAALFIAAAAGRALWGRSVLSQTGLALPAPQRSARRPTGAMRRLAIFVVTLLAIAGASIVAGPLLLRGAVEPLLRKALKRTPFRIVALDNPSVRLYSPMLAVKKIDFTSRGTSEVLGQAYENRLSLRLSPSPLHPTLFLHMGRVVLLRHLSDLTWEGDDTRRFVTNMVVNLQRLPLEWSIGELTWSGGPPPQVTLRDVSGTVTVKEPDKLMLTAKGRLEASGLPAFPKHGSLHLRGQVQHYYDATKFTGSLEWLPDPKDNQRRKESRLTCQLMGFLIPTLAEGALPEPSSCSVYPADPEDRRFWTTLVGRPLPSRGQQSAR